MNRHRLRIAAASVPSFPTEHHNNDHNDHNNEHLHGRRLDSYDPNDDDHNDTNEFRPTEPVLVKHSGCWWFAVFCGYFDDDKRMAWIRWNDTGEYTHIATHNLRHCCCRPSQRNSWHSYSNERTVPLLFLTNPATTAVANDDEWMVVEEKKDDETVDELREQMDALEVWGE